MTAVRVFALALAAAGGGLAAQAQTALQPTPPESGPTAKWQQPCQRDFTELRREVEKRGLAAKTAGESHKASREEMCKVVTAYSEAETKWIKYSADNMSTCGIPREIVDQIKQAHARTEETRARLCGGQPKRLKYFQKIAGR